MKIILVVIFRILIKITAFLFRHTFEESIRRDKEDFILTTIIGSVEKGVCCNYWIHGDDFNYPKDHVNHLYNHYKDCFLFYIKGIKSIPKNL